MANELPIQLAFEFEEIRAEIEKGPEFYTIRECAEVLNIHYITMYRLCAGGEIVASQVGSCWRISKAALTAYLERRHPFNMPDKD